MAKMFCQEKLLSALKELQGISKLEGSVELGAKMATTEEPEKLIDSFSVETLVGAFESLCNHLFSFTGGDREIINRICSGIKRSGRICIARRMW